MKTMAAALAALALFGADVAKAEDTLKLAVGQRGNWDTSVSEIGQRAGANGRARPANDLTVVPPAISSLDTPSRERTRMSEQLALRSIAPEPYFPALLPQVPGQGEVWESNR